MFGYVRACKPELKVKDFEMYKAVYCSLCRKLGKSYGFLSRLTLSYDFTFLCLLNLSLKDGCNPIERKRCAFNPLKKCSYCKDDTAFDLPAAAAMIMLYYKIQDNIADEKGLKRLGYLMLRPLFSRARRKAEKSFPEIERIVAEYTAKQSLLEKENCRELDRAAEPTANALKQILALCSEDNSDKRVLEQIGYLLGRYIYLLDAACDLPKDIKTGSYNPLSFTVEGEPKKYAAERLTPQLYICANEASKAFELLEVKKYKDILGNIIYLGLEDTFKKELA